MVETQAKAYPHESIYVLTSWIKRLVRCQEAWMAAQGVSLPAPLPDEELDEVE